MNSLGNHSELTQQMLDRLLSLPEQPPADTEPPHPAPTVTEPPEPTAEEPTAEEPKTSKKRPEKPSTPPSRQKKAPATQVPVQPSAPASAPLPSRRIMAPRRAKERVQVSMTIDRDLLALIGLAKAASNRKNSDLVLDAARAYRNVAHELPDAPEVVLFQDDLYDERMTLPANRQQITPYMTPRGRNQLDDDAYQCGLTRSDFVCRVLRAYLTMDKAFVPLSMAKYLQDPPEILMDALKVHLDSSRPSADLPVPGREPWVMCPVTWSELRELVEEAISGAMPGCTSATQAFLTVLSSEATVGEGRGI